MEYLEIFYTFGEVKRSFYPLFYNKYMKYYFFFLF